MVAILVDEDEPLSVMTMDGCVGVCGGVVITMTEGLVDGVIVDGVGYTVKSCGCGVGFGVGFEVGGNVGIRVGHDVGIKVGDDVGDDVGIKDGAVECKNVG